MTSAIGAVASSENLAQEAFRLESPSFVPTRIYFGHGSSRCFMGVLNALMKKRGGQKVLLITGGLNPRKYWMEMFDTDISSLDHVIVRNAISNPTLDSVGEALDTARNENVDTVVAVGGGSVLDTGKAVAALARSSLSIEEALARKSISDDPLTYLAVPATSGTGSEVTSYATIWDDKAKTKHSLSNASIYPAAAIIDPSLCVTMPPEIAAGTGLDALSHAMESCWSINSTDESIAIGLSAIELLMENLEKSVAAPDDTLAVANVSKASLFAGMSIAQGQTTISHAISYPLTVRYDIHHGHACGSTVGSLLQYNDQVTRDDCQDPRGYDHVRSVLDRIVEALGASDADDAETRINHLINTIGLETFGEFEGIDMKLLAENVIGYDRFGNNPRRMAPDQLIAFLDRLAKMKH
jgi:alcohol dehydrogenase class IV